MSQNGNCTAKLTKIKRLKAECLESAIKEYVIWGLHCKQILSINKFKKKDLPQISPQSFSIKNFLDSVYVKRFPHIAFKVRAYP